MIEALNNKPLAVLLGGTSAERDISLTSGRTILDAFTGLGYDVREIDPADSDWIAQLKECGFAFNILHGPGGEDGTIQGALEMLGIPYTGSGVMGSALAMDKRRTKLLWMGAGLATAGFVMLEDSTDWQGVIDRFGKVFVKPSCEGSSIGMAPASSAAELEAAYQNARGYHGGVLAEKFIDGPEYTVGILGGEALPSIRMETDNVFYDYEAKYISNDTRYHCPSGLNAQEEAELAALATAAFDSLGCAIWGRVDTMRDRDGTFYLLEVNTIPGMTSHSLVPMAARKVGLEVPALVERILELSAAGWGQ